MNDDSRSYKFNAGFGRRNRQDAEIFPLDRRPLSLRTPGTSAILVHG
jgi:hypothetical protein